MDERLKNIIEQTDQIRAESARKLQELEEERRRAQQIKNEQDRQAAAIWVKENIFSLIEKADRSSEPYLYFSDWVYNDKINYGCKIPARFLIAEIRKIDGLRIEENFNHEQNCYDGPSNPDYWSYYVKWRPEKRK